MKVARKYQNGRRVNGTKLTCPMTERKISSFMSHLIFMEGCKSIIVEFSRVCLYKTVLPFS